MKSSQQTGTRLPHTEIDLLFTWDGRLWLVDCKDRMPAENLAVNFRGLLPPLSPEAEELYQRIHKELSISQTKVMKEDILSVREAGGLLGQVVCVRKAEMPEEVVQYARLNHIEVILKKDLWPVYAISCSQTARPMAVNWLVWRLNFASLEPPLASSNDTHDPRRFHALRGDRHGQAGGFAGV